MRKFDYVIVAPGEWFDLANRLWNEGERAPAGGRPREWVFFSRIPGGFIKVLVQLLSPAAFDEL